jgi:hypothetical protein
VAQTFRDGRTVNMLRTGSGGRKQTEDIVATYKMRVRGLAPKRFITGRMPDLRRTLNDNLRGIFARSLSRIAGGGDE